MVVKEGEKDCVILCLGRSATTSGWPAARHFRASLVASLLLQELSWYLSSVLLLFLVLQPTFVGGNIFV